MAEFMLECFSLLETQRVEVIRTLAKNGTFFTKKDIMDYLNLNPSQAGALLKEMMKKDEIQIVSRGKGSMYTGKNNELVSSPISNEERLTDLIRSKGEITIREIKEELDINPSTVNALLCSLIKKGCYLENQEVFIQ